ncbi:MAG: outer membrane lipoprotein carrier protein LolA [Marinilabiliaceae bacterium]|nr:outer membrane lipoprotein carrier protein LolA [Marinilabiliaceae bacterium]
MNQNKKDRIVLLLLMAFFYLLNEVYIISQDKKIVSITDLQKEMLDKTSGVENVSCSFEQYKHLKFLDEVVQSKGKLVFDKQNRLRWEYLHPFEYLIVINENKFYIKTEGRISKYDVESNKMFSQICDLIISSVNGSIFTDSRFKVQAYVNNGQYELNMEPTIKEMREVIKHIKLLINKADFSVDKVVMYENGDDYTEIIFSNKKFNATIPETTFSCN